MEVLDFLLGLHAHLSDPKNWTKGAMARDQNNYSISFNSPIACSWCLVGAIKKLWAFLDFNISELGFTDCKAVDLLLSTNKHFNGINSLIDANEKISHVELLEWIDRAIKLAQESK